MIVLLSSLFDTTHGIGVRARCFVVKRARPDFENRFQPKKSFIQVESLISMFTMFTNLRKVKNKIN